MLVCSGRPLPGCICMCKEMFSDAPCIHLSSRPGVIAGIREASFMISMAHAAHREEFYAAAGGGIARQAGCVPQPDPQVGSARVRTKPPCRPRLDAPLVVHIGFSPHLGSACRPSFRVPVKTCSSVAQHVLLSSQHAMGASQTLQILSARRKGPTVVKNEKRQQVRTAHHVHVPRLDAPCTGTTSRVEAALSMTPACSGLRECFQVSVLACKKPSLSHAGDSAAGAGAAHVHGGYERFGPQADGGVPQPEPSGAL